ncbi:MAG TPA: DNA translocase FtsK [Planctomycetota bacterium]|nr:DNA translocase FtsK [Planctomycetota bacterium]
MNGRDLSREIAGVLLLGLGAFALLALGSYSPGDYAARVFPRPPAPANLCGSIGASLAFTAVEWVGTMGGVAAAAALLVIAGSLLGRAEPRVDVGRRALGALVCVLVLSVVERIAANASILHPSGRNPGGFWGTFLMGELTARIDGPGAAIVLGAAALLGLVLATDKPLAELFQAGAKKAQDAAQKTVAAAGNALDEATAEARQLALATAAPAPAFELTAPPAEELPDLDPLIEDEGAVIGAERPVVEEPLLSTPVEERASDETSRVQRPTEEAPTLVAGSAVAEAPAAPPAPPVTPAPAPPPPPRAEEEPEAPTPPSPPAPPPSDPAHPLPPLTLLAPSEPAAAADPSLLDERARRIEDTLQQFKLDAKVAHVERGPNVTLFALELGRGVKVQRIHALLDNLALALRVPGAGGIRVQAPIPGTSWVGLEVPNEDQDTVRLRDLVENPHWRKKDPALPVFLGKDTAGRPLIADLAKMPHLLIAGATGSGKSVCLNTILLSLLTTRTSSEVKLILIDPKQVELQQFARVPHLLTPVVTEMKKAGAVLDWAVRKMEERYGILAREGVRHIRDYNALGKGHLPYVVVVVDELNDLMMVAQKEVEASITRLAQKSRAVGIHVILATQRPSVDVITGVIKSNLPARVAFQVTSKVDSRTILDMCGAEKLLGQGDMLFLPPGRGAPIRAKGAFVADDELDGVVEFLASKASPEFSEELAKVEVEKKNMRAAARAAVDAASNDDPEDAKRDSVYEDAVRVVLTMGKGSVSLLQRKLEIGYGRAARYIDMMAEDAILGPANGSKPREIRTTLEKFERLLEERRKQS